jgi:Zn-dependent peptidase ImmA (M78 family)
MIADYNSAVIESINLLKDYGYNQIPIDLNIVLKALRRTVRICSYTKFAAKNNLTIAEICEYFESDLGACAYDRKTERYVIYYNDTKLHEGLERFTIAHELGHIFLKHHIKANTDVFLRKGLSEGIYKAFENEANCFARNYLAPHPLVNLVTNISNNRSIYEIMDAFNISYEAAITRRNLMQNDGYRIKSEHKEYFNTYKILYGYYCMKCKNSKAGDSRYCKVCGEEYSVFVKGADRVFYEGLDLDGNMKLKVCPNCLNSVIPESENRCGVCGQYLYNDCSNIFCEEEKLSGYIRCCPKCSSATTFLQSGILKDWKNSLEFQLNKSEFEQKLCGKYGSVKELDNWVVLSLDLLLEGKDFAGKLLEHTTAKLCGDTLLIYAPKPLIKEKLRNQDVLDLIMANLEPELGIKAVKIEIACFEDFYPESRLQALVDL